MDISIDIQNEYQKLAVKGSPERFLTPPGIGLLDHA